MTFKSASLILSISLLAGCSRTVVIPPGTIVRLSRPAKGLHVAAFDHRNADGSLVYTELPGTVDFPAGTYLVPPATQPSR